MSLLLLGLAVAALAFAARGAAAGRRASFAALAVAYGAPALVLAFVFLTSGSAATRFRFALLGLGFRGAPDAQLRVPVGGDRDRDGVWISALAGRPTGSATALGDLVFHPPADGDTGTLSFAPAPGSRAGLLGIGRPGEPLRPLRAIDLADGDKVHAAGRVWEVEFDTGLFGPPAALVGAGGERVDLPPRLGRLPLGIPLRILRPLPAALETYPLAWLEQAAAGAVAEAAPEGFFYWQPRGFLGRRLWLASTDDAVVVERGTETLQIPQPALATARSVHVLSPPRPSAAFAAGGVRDRRSFRLLPGRRSFSLTFDTPEIHVLARDTLEELAVGGAQDDDELRFNLSMGGWQVTDKSLYFRHVSRRVALESLATLELPRRLLDGRGGVRFTAATPRGQRQGRLGEPIWLGGDNLAAVQIDVLRPPLRLALLALALAALKALAARAARLGVPHLLFAAALEALVTLRLLLGYRVWILPPFEQEALELALAAWAFVPWSFLVASAPAREPWATEGNLSASLGRPLVGVLPALGGWFFALAWCRVFGGGGVRTWVWMLCLAAALAVWIVRALDLPQRLGEVVSRWTERERAYRKTLGLWAAVAFVPALARLVLLFFGNRESLLLGSQRFALSLVHVPLALLIEAACLVWLWRRATEERRLGWSDLTPALAVVVGTWIVPALFANDLGLALLNVPVFLVALASVALAAGRRLAEEGAPGGERLVAAAPAAVLALYLIFAAFPLGARLLIAVLPARTEIQLQSERNYLRLLAFAYPERLERVARRSSEELTVMSAVMRSYTSGPFLGRGYFASELSPHIRATALREHAPAVFVAAEWGLAGVVGLLLIFGTAGLAGRAAAVWNADEEGFGPTAAAGIGGTAAFLAGLTVAVPSVYMVLANYRLTLFTGKNAYLLGLDSTADVLEVFLLAMLFAFGVSLLRDEEGTS